MKTGNQRERESQFELLFFNFMFSFTIIFTLFANLCAVVLHLKRFSRATNYYLNFDMHLRVCVCVCVADKWDYLNK